MNPLNVQTFISDGRINFFVVASSGVAPTGSNKSRKRAPGAGRKPLGKLRVNFKLKPETHELIERRAAKAGLTRSEFVERTILEACSE
jgi:hypothetical protein